MIDIDPQGNTTSGFGLDKDEIENTVYELMLDECTIKESMIKVENIEHLTIIPSNVNLAGAEIELLGINEKEYILKNAVDYIKDDYDFIIIDCPPSLNMLTVNAMTTADTVLVPIQCEYYALEGISQLIHTIDRSLSSCFRMKEKAIAVAPSSSGTCPVEVYRKMAVKSSPRCSMFKSSICSIYSAYKTKLLLILLPHHCLPAHASRMPASWHDASFG